MRVRVAVSEAPADAAHARGSGARDLHLLRNGSLVRLWQDDALHGKSTATFEATVKLVAGTNDLQAYAFNSAGVRNAATRKYLTHDWLWYWPPGEMTERLAAYANAHGRPSGWPYYSLDGERPVTAQEWDALRYRWRHAHGSPGHGRSHVMPALIPPYATVPVIGGRLALGTWQSVVLVDLNVDNPDRQVRLSFLG